MEAAGKAAGKSAGGKGYPGAKGKGCPAAPKSAPNASKGDGKSKPRPAPFKPTKAADPKKDWERLQKLKDHKDLNESKEIEDVDMSRIDESCRRERVTCPRCEKEIDAEYFQSHVDAHSSQILPWLYLGAYRNTQDEKELTVRTGITHVLNLAGGECTMNQEIKVAAEAYNAERGLCFEYIKYYFADKDHQDMLPQLDEVLELIESRHAANPEHHVLVHCVQGISRSSSVVIAYLMKAEKMSLREAYNFVKKKRTVADPRATFLDQLGVFEKRLFGVAQPSFSGEEAFAGRQMLNLDVAPVAQKPAVASVDMQMVRGLVEKLEAAAGPVATGVLNGPLDEAAGASTLAEYAGLVERVEAAVERLVNPGPTSAFESLTGRLEVAVGRLEKAAAGGATSLPAPGLSPGDATGAAAAAWAAKLEALLQRIEVVCGSIPGRGTASA